MHKARRRRSGQSSVRPLALLALVGVALLAAWWLAISPPASPSDRESGSMTPAGNPGASAPADPSRPVAQPSPLTLEPKPTALSSRKHELPESPAATAEQGEAPAPAKAPAGTAVVPTRQGPVDELSKRFAGESRADSSTEQDARVRAAFSDPAIPSEMLHSVECRRSVCRAELRWTAEHDVGYVLGLTRAVGSLSAPLGIEAPGAPDDSGARPLVVYFGLTH